jgi:hypothetical protein
MCKHSSLKIYPRCKQVDGQVQHPQPVVLSLMTLEEYFSLPLNEAAKKLGVCETSLKCACRKIGIKKWPYRKVCLASHITHVSIQNLSRIDLQFRNLGQAKSRSSTNDPTSPDDTINEKQMPATRPATFESSDYPSVFMNSSQASPFFDRPSSGPSASQGHLAAFQGFDVPVSAHPSLSRTPSCARMLFNKSWDAETFASASCERAMRPRHETSGAECWEPAGGPLWADWPAMASAAVGDVDPFHADWPYW